jgi:hypothetical protein
LHLLQNDAAFAMLLIWDRTHKKIAAHNASQTGASSLAPQHQQKVVLLQNAVDHHKTYDAGITTKLQQHDTPGRHRSQLSPTAPTCQAHTDHRPEHVAHMLVQPVKKHNKSTRTDPGILAIPAQEAARQMLTQQSHPCSPDGPQPQGHSCPKPQALHARPALLLAA